MQKLSKLLDTPIKYFTALALLAVPLYPKFPFIRVPGTFVSIRLEDFIIAILGLLWLIAALPNIKKVLRDPITKAILLFIGVGFVSLVSALFVTKTVSPTIGFLHWMRRIEYLIPFFVGSYVVTRDRTNLNFFFKIILIVVAIAFVYGFGQKYFTWPIIITQNQEYAKGVALRWISGSHINSTFAGHYDLATFLVLVLPIMIPAIFVLKGKITKTVLVTVSLFGLWLMANAVSRISLASYLGAVTLAFILIRKYKPIIPVLIVSIVFFGMTSTVITRYERVFDVVRTKIETMTQAFEFSVYAQVVTPSLDLKIENQQASPQPEDRSSSIRFNVEWPRALRALTKNPLLGTGYSSTTLATDNDYLRALGEVGILGLLSFALIIIRILSRYISNLPFVGKYKGLELVFIAGTFAAIPGLLLNAVFIDIFEASKFAIMFWFVMGFSVATLETKIKPNVKK